MHKPTAARFLLIKSNTHINVIYCKLQKKKQTKTINQIGDHTISFYYVVQKWPIYILISLINGITIYIKLLYITIGNQPPKKHKKPAKT